MTAIDKAQAAADLRQTRREIETRGWCQGAMHAPDGAVCAVGGIRQAVLEGKTFGELNQYELAEVSEREQTARDGLGLYLWEHDIRATIPFWNDAPERTQAEVCEVFDKAAAWIEEQA